MTSWYKSIAFIYILFLFNSLKGQINRGFVNSGPYCAGANIVIPYDLSIAFDTSNYFVVFLSDENGKFNSNSKEIAKLKSNKDSVLKGSLPLKNIHSSSLYKIKIISTNPFYENDYLADTLHLKIYSKDKVYLGNDTLICSSDSLQLNCFAGTSWSWTPNYNIQTTIRNKTVVWPAKTTTYKLVIKDSSGCSNSDSASIVVAVSNNFKLKIDKDTVCEISLSKFEIIPPTNSIFNYILKSNCLNFDSILIGDEKSLNRIVHYYTAGYYPSQLIVQSSNGCIDTITGPSVFVDSRPIADFTHTKNATVSHPEISFTNLSKKAFSYKWLFPPLGFSNDTNLVLNFPRDTGIYWVTLIAFSLTGCADTVITFTSVGYDEAIYMPDVFSPNNDGVNDTYAPVLNSYKFKMSIYNISGQLIFETNKRIGWDGNYMGQPAPIGNYLYIINASEFYGDKKILNGMFSLIR